MYISQHRYSIERMPDAFGGERGNLDTFLYVIFSAVAPRV